MSANLKLVAYSILHAIAIMSVCAMSVFSFAMMVLLTKSIFSVFIALFPWVMYYCVRELLLYKLCVLLKMDDPSDE